MTVVPPAIASNLANLIVHQHDKQPNAAMCFACGVANIAGLQMAFYNDGEKACLAQVTLDDKFQGYPGMAHGGISATILDEALGRAAFSGNPNRFMFTGKLELRYRKNVPLNTLLTVKARIDKDRGRMAMASGELLLEDGTVLVEATATLMAIPQEALDQIDAEAVGWKIYP